MKTLQMIHYFNFVIATVFVVFYFYQIGYLLLGLFMKHRKGSTGPHKLHRYAAVISARNEANVIGGLIASLKAQNYPCELLDIYVIAGRILKHLFYCCFQLLRVHGEIQVI